METYSVLRVLGEGSFGRALLVRCGNSQEEYVVKEIQLPKVCANKDSDVLYTLLLYLCPRRETGVEPAPPSAASNNNNITIIITDSNKHSYWIYTATPMEKVIRLTQRAVLQPRVGCGRADLIYQTAARTQTWRQFVVNNT